jgi:hypothetical protein
MAGTDTADLTRTQYADETATLLARELLDGATADMTVAVVSAPSVFVALKNILVRLPSLYSVSPSSQ